ncbi:hypothetical protein RZS08_19085, partial [Arthrospira platensis SPKY1]|nr:hypothetical protein [Arthrospira platensis SPKY1]
PNKTVLRAGGDPLRFGRQAPTGPPAPGLGLEEAEVTRRCHRVDGLPWSPALLFPDTVGALAQVAWRLPRLLLAPGPAGLAPEAGLAVAATVDKGQELRPAHDMGVDAQVHDVDRVRAQLVVERKARAVKA